MTVRPGAKIVVQSWAGGWGRALREAVSDPFERETGIAVEHATHVGLKLSPALQAALDGGERPPVDVVWSNSIPALSAAARGDSLPIPVTELPAVDELARRAWPAGQPQQEHVFLVHPYVVYYVLAYHEGAFPNGPPSSWRVLFDERHRGRIALYPGGNGFYPIAQVLGGGKLTDIPDAMTACFELVRSVRDQIGELDYSIGMEERLRSRGLDICFRALTNALAFREAGVPVAWCIPEEGTTDTVDALWVPRGVPEPAAALSRRYIAFALRRDVQEAWCARLGAMPVHRGAAVPVILRRSDLPIGADDYRGILHVPEALKVTHELDWEARFNAALALPARAEREG